MSGKRLTKRFSADIPPAGSSSRRKERRARAASEGGRGLDVVELELAPPDDRASSNNIVACFLLRRLLEMNNDYDKYL
jgi:hypothetical protein